jgi:hypothetical protein
MSVRRASEKYPLFLSDFNKRLNFFFQQIFENYSGFKFHENPSIGRRILCGWKDTTNVLVAFRNFANAAKIYEKITIRNATGVGTRSWTINVSVIFESVSCTIVCFIHTMSAA